MDISTFLQHCINGLTLGGMYALVALGYTMVYGIIELINFAHGEIFMIGGFIGLMAIGIAASLGFTSPLLLLFAAFIVALPLTGLLGFTLEKLAYRPLRNTPRITALLAALGASIFLYSIMSRVYTDAQEFPTLIDGGFEFHLGGTENAAGLVVLRNVDLFVMIVSIVLMIGLQFLVQRTKLGKSMRAVAQDREAAMLMGIDVNRVISATFIIGSVLAAAGGILNGLTYETIKFDMGYKVGIKAFTAAVLGGIGNIQGAMLGGVILGLSEGLAPPILDAFGVPEALDYKDLVAFVILILTLIVLPTGLMGERVQEKV